jgi:hypothetical protein
MGVQWYYGRGSDITGPISGRELASLAQSGGIVATDTVWQEGNEMGVKAGRVKNLFPPTAMAIETVLADAVVIETLPAEPSVATEVVKVDAVPPAAAPPSRPIPKAGRARAGKGALIVSQDGKTVKFRMKCTVCGREDSSWKSIQIPHGVHRASFYCTTCRKKRDAEVHGVW